MLKNKHIILGITGGIAAYKSAMLLRLLVKAGAEVQVVMTPSAKEFITPVTLSALSGKPVVSEFFTANTGEWHSHVDLGLWADAMVIAPATACTLAKMATGVADNMLVTTYLSAKAPVFVAPAMDLDMMAHPSTERNLATLQSDGVTVIEAEAGELASHLVGKGRMAEPETIAAALERHFAQCEELADKELLITAGPTYERIDPVRFIGNFSTGKMGYALAEEAAKRGARVTLVSGPVSLEAKHPNIKVISVESAREMHDACVKAWPGADAAIMCAAVADYAPAKYHDKKIKREGHETPVIELVKNPDIAAALGKTKREGQVLVGFALETDNEQANALDKMRRKGLDFIALNSLKSPDAGFGVDTNRVTLFAADGTATELPFGTKTAVAASILNNINL